jgi:hypothetical protein
VHKNQKSVFVGRLCCNLIFVTASGVRLGHESEGAGVVFSSNNRWYIKGVISVHEPNQGKVSTYTLTAQYMNWISNVCATV